MSAEPKRSRLVPLPPTERPCADREHLPPGHLYIPPGHEYIHVCPTCGQEWHLRAPEVSL